MKKNNGISLISLIITTIVIVILTAAIVVNVFDTNIIGNANESVFKSDMVTMQEQLNMYIGNQYSSTLGKYDSSKLYATEEGIWYDVVQLNGTIADILPDINEKYIGKIFIQNGKIVADKITITSDEEEWLRDIGIGIGYKVNAGRIVITPSTTEYINGDVTLTISYTKEIPEGYVIQYKIGEGIWQEGTEVVVKQNNTMVAARLYNESENDTITSNSCSVSNIDKEPPIISGMSIGISATENTVTAIAIGAKDTLSGNVTYLYSLDNSTWQTSGTFTGIKSGSDVTVYAKAIDKVGNESASISTKGNTLAISAPTVNLVNDDWTKDDIIATVTGMETPPKNYVLQYKLSGGMTQNWTAYTEEVTINANNTTMKARYYNEELDDEIVSTSKTAEKIDKVAPDITNMSISISSTNNTITAIVSGATDSLSGEVTYRYSLDDKTWQTSNTFTGIKNGTAVTVYAKAIDKVGNESASMYMDGKTIAISAPQITLVNDEWTKDDVVASVSGKTYEGYVLQYKLSGGMTKDWTTYTSDVTISANNTTMTARYYNEDLEDEILSTPKTAEKIDKVAPTVVAYSGARLYDDQLFEASANGISKYNTSGNGNVTVTWKEMPDSPSGSGYGVEIKTTGTASPGHGGFTFATPTAKNKTFVTRIVAKIPSGLTINFATNDFGTGGTSKWLTPNVGTGTWQEYAYLVQCGSTGTFSTTNSFYLSGGTASASSPITWQLAFATVIDTTKWDSNNNIVYIGNDNESKIVAYGVSTSETTEPEYRTVTENDYIVKMTNTYTSNVTRYIWLKDKAGNVSKLKVVVGYVDTIAPTPPESVSVTVGTNSVTVTASGSTDSESGFSKYQYSLDNFTWQDSGTFTGIKSGTETIVYARAVDKVGNASSSIFNIGTTTTPVITGLTLNLTGTYINAYFKAEVTPKITYTSISSNDYVLQYKLLDGNWTTVTSGTTLSKITNNTTLVFRLYNELLDDEAVDGITFTKQINGENGVAVDSYQTVISNVDSEIPTVSPDITITAGIDCFTASPAYVMDSGSGVLKVEYSIDNVNWKDTGEFTGLDVITTYTVYVRAIDKVGYISEVVSASVTTEAPIVTDNNKTLRGGNFAYDNPVIPVGFKALETKDGTWTDTNNDSKPDGWNNGLVIQDEIGNQFVWVPVDGTNVVYKNRFDDYEKKQSTLTGVVDDLEALPMNNNNTARIAELSQVTYYGGFYVGRYEAGVPTNQTTIDGTSEASDTTGTPVVQKDVLAWTYLSYTNAVANSMSLINGSSVKSGLITGTQWDTMCAWIENSGINVSTDSTSWGNYTNSSSPANVSGYGQKQTTGKSEYWKAKNIYDIAGNAYEFTSELNSSNTDKIINRGGRSEGSGIDNPATYRYGGNEYSKSTASMGFRIVLYVDTPTSAVAVDSIVKNENSTINAQLFAYNNPVIPVGFKSVNTDEASWNDADKNGEVDDWNNGLVIQDEIGNQFVWVPVDGTNIKYTKWCTVGVSHTMTLVHTDALPMKDETTVVTETEQITKYGGFYIGRYEAGVPANQTTIDGKSKDTSNTTGIPTVQQGANVWGCITYTNAMSNAKSFINTENVKSGLITGTQWDTVCAWINSETDSEGNPIHDVTNSVSWGNYSNTTGRAQYDDDGTTKISGKIQTAGKSEYWKAKNIYDLAGNTDEWIGERHQPNYSIIRGGWLRI